MKLGSDVAPQVLKCIWGNNSCSSIIAGVKALEMFALQFCCLYEISP